VVNATQSTDFCAVRIGDERRPLSVQPGASGEAEVPSGSSKVCVLACKEGQPLQGASSTNAVGCGPFDLSEPREIYVFEGTTIPDAPPAPGFKQTRWLNNIDPRYAENRRRPWLDPFGNPRKGAWHIAVKNPSCPKTGILGYEDVKGHGQRTLPVDPQMTRDYFGDKPPVYIYFSLDPAGMNKTPLYDLPEGSYEFEIKPDCNTLDLKSESYPAGASKKAKRLP
jgi:hypothetical protein